MKNRDITIIATNMIVSEEHRVIAKSERAFEQPYWWQDAAFGDDHAIPEQVSGQFDVCVIGAGFTGLSAALGLAEAGAKVVICESRQPGYGASSRNGGMIGHGHKLSFVDAAKRYGAERAARFTREGMASVEGLRSKVERLGLDCDLQPTGRFRAAHTPEAFDRLRRERDAMAPHVPLETLEISREDMAEELTTDLYCGGLVYPSHMAVQPAKMVKGLIGAAERAGVTLYGHTPVGQVERETKGWKVTTDKGKLSAQELVVATNGYSFGAPGPFAKAVIPVNSFLAATEVLGENAVRSLIPRLRSIVETRASYLYFRPSPDHQRILMGGRAALTEVPMERSSRWLQQQLQRLFPDFPAFPIEHCWTGRTAFTRQTLPVCGKIDGMWYAMGYCGSGVAMSNWLGDKLALKILRKPEGETAFDSLNLETYPFYDGRPWFLPIVNQWQRYLEWRDRKASGPYPLQPS